LVEISVVVMIIGMLATMSLPSIRKAGDVAKMNTYVNDLRVFSGAFNQYAQINGKWPEMQSAGQDFPADMSGHLANSSWTRVSPIGGSYTWDRNVLQNGRTIAAAISLVDEPTHPLSVNSAHLQEIYAKLDDGDLATGLFQLGFNNYPIYILEGETTQGVAPPPPPPPPSSGGGAFGGWFFGALLLLGITRWLRQPQPESQ
jgi:type II secretory pathway pseudopilin PulG